MVVRLVRAGVGALLLLIAVPLALAGGGLLLAMEHRAADDTFRARLEPVRTDGTAVVVPDVDALLRADAPFARGGQTTLSLSAVGSGGPLFIGLAPEAQVKRYLGERTYTNLTHVRLARGPLPVELTTMAANRTGKANPAPPAEAPAQDPAAVQDPAAAPQDPAAQDPAAQDPATVQDPAAPSGQEPANPRLADKGEGPAGETFWTARSVQRDGRSELTWSASALRGKHLSLVVMRADGTDGIDAAITARLAPAWLGPTTGGLLMLGGALFFLALITLAWPPARPALQAAGAATGTEAEDETPAEPEPLPIPAQPTSETRDEESINTRDEEPNETRAEETAEEPAATATAEEPKAEEPKAEEPKVEKARVMATLADVMAAADAEREPEADEPKAEEKAMAECELDRPAPKDVELDIDLPPLPAMPAIDIQFTWAPLEVAAETDETDQTAKTAAR
ncbi:hypothetical protein ACQP00_47575 [Dactylosporangium sp. CS-047395]|uniref:hypothetical protein n=1 Tax=Dactylosporangium sp. CS-047395 TaxID=3239936 RepID=UPI003D8D47F8